MSLPAEFYVDSSIFEWINLTIAILYHDLNTTIFAAARPRETKCPCRRTICGLNGPRPDWCSQ